MKTHLTKISKFFNLFKIKYFILNRLKLFISFLSIGFVLFSFSINLEKLLQLPYKSESFAWLILGIFVGCLSIYVNAFAWKELLISLNLFHKNIDFVALFVRSNLLKYAPGGIWHFAERLSILKRNMNTKKAITSVLIEPFLMLSAALFLVPFGLWYSGYSILFFLPCISFFPKFRGILFLWARRIKFKQLNKIEPDIISIDEQDYYKISSNIYPLRAFLLEIIFIFCRFIGFWTCLKAFDLEQSISLFKYLSGFSLAWSLGLIVPGAPGGIGVFESVLLLLLGNLLPAANLIAVLISYRLIVTVSDILVAINYLINRAKSIPYDFTIDN